MAARAQSIVRNPLTLMAVFAGLAEVSATIALPRLEGGIQSIFVWFVIVFPFCIIAPFFIFLWFRPWHLYAPSDFRSDPMWMTDRTPPHAASVLEKKPKSKVPKNATPDIVGDNE